MKEIVNGIEREFPNVGCRVLLDATAEIRKVRQEAFAIAGGSICGVGDPSVSPDQTWMSIDHYMSDMTVKDTHLFQWFKSYDGTFFLIGKSLSKSDKKLSLQDVNSIIDSLTTSQVARIGEELLVALFPEMFVKRGSDDTPVAESDALLTE